MIVALAVIAMSIYGLCQLSGLWNRVAPLPMPTQTATSVATATLVPTWTPTGTPAPTTEPTAEPTGTPVPVLMPGIQAMVSGTGSLQLRLRSAPGLNQELLRTLADGTRLKVLEGPLASEGYSWWKVQTEDGLEGWVAGDWLVPTAPQ